LTAIITTQKIGTRWRSAFYFHTRDGKEGSDEIH
jgi:hypothetical protein